MGSSPSLGRVYQRLQRREDRSVGRVTECPRRVQDFIPMQREPDLLDDLDDEQIAVAARNVSDFDIRDLIKAEQNLARFLHNVIDYIGEESNSLIARIEKLCPSSPAFQSESAFEGSASQ